MRRAPDAWLTDPVECGPAAGFGLYLHVPFCTHRCGYCDFATTAVGPGSDAEVAAGYDRYLAALLTDLGRQVAAGPSAAGLTGPWPRAGSEPGEAAWPRVSSVFVGGGTPTLLGGARLARLLAAVRTELDLHPQAEITVECNPETASPELFAALAAAGVTRVSLGVQSLAPHVLRTLERSHTPERPARTVAEARAAGILEVSVDLIYGTPGEDEADWLATLAGMAALPIDHVSAYALSVHANTAFGRAVATGQLPAPDDDVQRDRFEVARRVLTAAGFEHYEVSNLARVTRPTPAGPAPARSVHNLLYWRHGDYLAVGVGAHGHLGGRRWWTTRSTTAYLDAVAAGRSPIAGGETLDEDQRAVERLLLGLRVREGLHPGDVPPLDPAALEDAMAAGLVETACGRLRCTASGWYLLDAAVDRLTG